MNRQFGLKPGVTRLPAEGNTGCACQQQSQHNQALGNGLNDRMWELHVFAGELIAGGDFTGPGFHLARWNGSAWHDVGAGANGDVYALGQYNNQLIAAGVFDAAGVTPANRIASWARCPCPADVFPSSAVDVDDLLFVVNQWGQSGKPGTVPGDVTGNGFVDIDDLLAVISAWGTCD